MRIKWGAWPLIAALLVAAPGRAAELSGEIGAVSDYRDRGVSLSQQRPALQAAITVSGPAGIYAELWGSTLDRSFDPARGELDATIGVARDLPEDFAIDLFATYVAYPASGSDNYVEFTGAASRAFKAFTLGGGLSYAPAQSALRGDDGRRRDNLYAFANASYTVPKTPLEVTAGLGFERGAFDLVEGGGKWDWRLGLEIPFGPARAGLAYSGSSADGDDRGGIVAGLFVDW